MAPDRLFSIIGSVAIHLLLLGILAFTMWDRHTPPKAVSQKPIIQAHAVDEEEALAPIRRREDERKKAKAEKQRQRDEKRKEAEAEKKRQSEIERKKVEAEKKREAEIKRKQAEAEKKRQAEIKRKQAEAEKQRLAEEQRKKEEAERKRREEADRKRREEEMQKQMAAEEERLAEEERARARAQMAREVDQYVAAITYKIQQHWQRPPGSASNFECKVLVKQIPSGDVVDVRVVESCGNIMLDRSVESAVRKASPLPLPKRWDPDFRELEITFVPE